MAAGSGGGTAVPPVASLRAACSLARRRAGRATAASAAASPAKASSTDQPGSQDNALPVTELACCSQAATLTRHPALGIDGPVTAVTRVTTPMPMSTTPDAALPSGIVRARRPHPTRTRRPCSSRDDPQSRPSHTSASTASGATIPATYVPLTASAAPNDAAEPVSATTPASTGAQHADAIPENSPSPYAAA